MTESEITNAYALFAYAIVALRYPVNYRIQLCGIIKEEFNESATLSRYAMMASSGGYGASFPRGCIISLLRKISGSCFQA